MVLLNRINKTEFLIRRSVLAEERGTRKTVKFVIGRSFDVLASGYVPQGSLNALAEAVKEAKLHYPTPEEIENEQAAKRDQLNIKRKLTFASPYNSPLFKKPKTRKKLVKAPAPEPLVPSGLLEELDKLDQLLAIIENKKTTKKEESLNGPVLGGELSALPKEELLQPITDFGRLV